MENDEIKKVIIYNENLPPVLPGNVHKFRFRVLSNDLSSSSQWSSIYTVAGNPVQPVSGNVTATTNRETFSATWGDENNRPLYDIFVRNSKALNTLASNKATVTLTTITSHGFSVGDIVKINISNNTTYDGTHTITSVANPTTFTYSLTTSSAQSTITVSGYATPASEEFFYYHGTSAVHSYTILNPDRSVNGSGINNFSDYIEVQVQVAGAKKVFDTETDPLKTLKIYRSGVIPVVSG